MKLRDEKLLLLNMSYEEKLQELKLRLLELQASGKNFVISFSGGKDSTMLLHFARKIIPDIKAVFINTGNEYAELVKFVKTFPNVETITPKIGLKYVLNHCGFPFFNKKQAQRIEKLQKGKTKMEAKDWEREVASLPFKISDQCCHYLKKQPAEEYAEKNNCVMLTAELAVESMVRLHQFFRYPCLKKNKYTIMSFFFPKEVDRYIAENNVKICNLYTQYGMKRTGCKLCGFSKAGFKELQATEPKFYEYACKEFFYLEKIKAINSVLSKHKIKSKYELDLFSQAKCY